MMKKIILTFLALFVFLLAPTEAKAQGGQVLGVHILNPFELDDVSELLGVTQSENQWRYVTIPFTLDDLNKVDDWSQFFDKARRRRIIPLIRLSTRFENGSWKIPTRIEVVEMLEFLARQDWPTVDKHIIVFNEVNHANEWGGRLDPVGYTRIFRFASSWAHSQGKNFIVMPAALDLAASNGGQTMEAFNYLNQMYWADNEIFSYLDVWNSHSYPNPGFSSSPERIGQNSLRGFEHELDYLKNKTGRDYLVFITETGWRANSSTLPWLESYYSYALENIWSDPRIIAVTPFLLHGSPGPFSSFSFIDQNGQPTAQYRALQSALAKRSEGG